MHRNLVPLDISGIGEFFFTHFTRIFMVPMGLSNMPFQVIWISKPLVANFTIGFCFFVTLVPVSGIFVISTTSFVLFPTGGINCFDV